MKRQKIPVYKIEDSKSKFFNITNNSSAYIIAEAANTSILSTIPYRSEFYAVGLCLTGSMTLNVNLFSTKVSPGSLVVMNSASIRSWHDRTENNKMLTLFFNKSIINTTDQRFIDQFAFFDIHSNAVFSLHPLQFKKLKTLLKDMLTVQASGIKQESAIISNYIKILLYHISAYTENGRHNEAMNLNAATQLTIAFKQTVADNFRQIRKIKDYAKLLFVSPKHLAQTITLVTGASATQLINDMVILEASVLLRQTRFTNFRSFTKLKFFRHLFFFQIF